MCSYSFIEEVTGGLVVSFGLDTHALRPAAAARQQPGSLCLRRERREEPRPQPREDLVLDDAKLVTFVDLGGVERELSVEAGSHERPDTVREARAVLGDAAHSALRAPDLEHTQARPPDEVHGPEFIAGAHEVIHRRALLPASSSRPRTLRGAAAWRATPA